MIKGNESDVGNIDFELQAKRDDKFVCFILFLNLKNCSYLGNQMSDWDEVWIKSSILNGQVTKIEKSKLNIADMWLIPLNRVTFMCLL